MPKYANKPRMVFSTHVPATLFYAKKPKMVFETQATSWQATPQLIRTISDGSNRTLSDGSIRTLRLSL